MDHTGERWDTTQAVPIGFDPDHFEFGIGRHVFKPLNDTHRQPVSGLIDSGMRIIGIAGNGDTHAYSVQTLSYLETTITILGSEAIVADY